MKEKQILIKYKEVLHNELMSADSNLVAIAIESAKTAYAPYSHFRVGAAILLSDGKIVKGSNQENAAYPSGLCAERVALFYANSNYPDKSVLSIAIVVINTDGDVIEQKVSPCGACRQVIVETEMRFKKSIKILLASRDSVLVFDSIEDLLPLSFKPNDLLLK